MSKDKPLSLAVKDKKGATMSPIDSIRQQADVLRDMPFDELMKLAEENEAIAIDASQTGDGYHLITSKDKEHLVGVPFVVMPEWDIMPSSQRPGQFFATLPIRTAHPVAKLGNHDHIRLNDGSTGIYRQLSDMKAKGFTGIIVCRNGLQVSKDYEVTEPVFDEKTGEPVIDATTGKQATRAKVDPVTGNVIKGTTYYLDTTV
jgi:hypothetical protein